MLMNKIICGLCVSATAKWEMSPRRKGKAIKKRNKRVKNSKIKGLPRDTPTISVAKIVQKAVKQRATQNGNPYIVADCCHLLTRGAIEAEQIRDIEKNLTATAAKENAKKLPKKIVLIERRLKDEIIDNLQENLPQKHPLKRKSVVLDPAVSFRSGCVQGY